jgi:integrase/recombinase XerD
VVTGPLAGYESALRAELTRVGYAPATVRDIIAAMVRVSGWMQRRRMAAADLGPAAVLEFLVMRRRATRVEQVARRGLGPLLRFLRGRGVIPSTGETGGSPVAALLADYRIWLAGERGLAAESVRCYLVQGGKFLADLPEPLDASLARLDAAAVVSFVMRQARGCGSVWSAKTLVTATRSLLRFCTCRA